MLFDPSRRLARCPIAAAVLLVTAAGCGSDSKSVNAPPVQPKSASASSAAPAGTAGSTRGIAGLADMQAELAASQQQIDAIIASLNNLVDPGQSDLRGAYNRFSDELSRMSGHEYTLQREATAMRASREAYFTKWEGSVADIDNPTIRASADARRQRLRDLHERITTDSGAARDAYVPFMRDLQDVRKYLANDLSKSSIADVHDTVVKVNREGATVRSKISALQADLSAVQSASTQ